MTPTEILDRIHRGEDDETELKRWAAVELRSLNGQIEFVLRDALRRRKAHDAERRTKG